MTLVRAIANNRINSVIQRRPVSYHFPHGNYTSHLVLRMLKSEGCGMHQLFILIRSEKMGGGGGG